MATVKHAKTNSIPNWTQTDVDQLIAQGFLPPGSTPATIILNSDWNTDHLVSNIVNADISASANIALSKTNISLTTTGSSGAATINTATGVLNIPNYAGGSGQSAIQYQDEGSNIGTSGTTTTVNFVGAGVTAASASNVVTVTIPGGGGGSTDAVTKSITQTAHGFTVGQVLYYNGTAWALAQGDTAAKAEAVGIVSSITSANVFVLTTSGYVSGLTGLTPGMNFLDPTVAGGLTTTKPITAGQIDKPLFFATSATDGYFLNYRGMVVGSGGSQVTDGNFYMATGANMTIPLISSARYAFQIAGVYNLKTASGTITAAVQINGTNVTGLGALAVTTTPQTVAATAANNVVIGDRVTLVLSSNATATGIEFSMGGLR